jgi:hypothetical protein
MVKVLAYRVQEARFGNLEPATAKRLQQIAKACTARSRAHCRIYQYSNPERAWFANGTGSPTW